MERTRGISNHLLIGILGCGLFLSLIMLAKDFTQVRMMDEDEATKCVGRGCYSKELSETLAKYLYGASWTSAMFDTVDKKETDPDYDGDIWDGSLWIWGDGDYGNKGHTWTMNLDVCCIYLDSWEMGKWYVGGYYREGDFGYQDGLLAGLAMERGYGDGGWSWRASYNIYYKNITFGTGETHFSDVFYLDLLYRK